MAVPETELECQSMIVPGTPQRKVEKQVMNVKIDKVVGPSAELVLFVSPVVQSF